MDRDTHKYTITDPTHISETSLFERYGAREPYLGEGAFSRHSEELFEAQELIADRLEGMGIRLRGDRVTAHNAAFPYDFCTEDQIYTSHPLLPRTAWKNYSRHRDTLRHYHAHHSKKGREMSLVALPATPGSVQLGQPLRDIIAAVWKNQRDLLDQPQVVGEIALAEIEPCMARVVIAFEGHAPFPQLHLTLSHPKTQDICGFLNLLSSEWEPYREKLKSRYADAFSNHPAGTKSAYVMPPHQHADLAGAAIDYICRPTLLPPNLPDDTLKWLWDELKGTPLFEKLGGFKAFASDLRKSNARVIRLGDATAVVTSTPRKPSEDAEKPPTEKEDAEAETDRESAADTPEEDATAQQNFVLKRSLPAAQACGRMMHQIIVKDFDKSLMMNATGSEATGKIDALAKEALAAYKENTGAEPTLQEIFLPPAEHIMNRAWSKNTRWRMSMHVSPRLKRLIEDHLGRSFPRTDAEIYSFDPGGGPIPPPANSLGR